MFAPRLVFGSLDLTDAPYMLLPERDMGAPETIADVVDSLLADGEVLSFNRSGNRSIRVSVYIEEGDSVALADAEKALALEVARSTNTLTVEPGDGYGATSVFETFTGSMSHVVDDDAERAGLRRYDLTLPALPFARPVDPTTVTLTYGTATSGTTLDDGSSTTGWTVSGNGGTARALSTVTYLGEAALRCLTTNRTAGLSFNQDTFEKSGVALTSARPFLAVDVAEDNYPTGVQRVIVEMRPTGSGSFTGYEAVSSEPQASGYRRYFFAHGLAGTTVDVRVTIELGYQATTTTDSTYVGGLYAYASAPATGLMIVDVEGSQRAPFSLRLSRATGTLGQVFVFADPAMLTYGYNPGVSATWQFAPAGTYTVAVPSTAIANHTYVLTINGQSSTTRAKTTGETLWFEFHLGATRTGRLGSLTTTLTDNGSTATVPSGTRLFRNSAETSLVALSNVGYQHLFIDSPTLESGFVGLWGGSSSDGSDAVSVASAAICADPLHLLPPVTPLYISQAGAATTIDSVVTYYSRHHTFVAQAAG